MPSIDHKPTVEELERAFAGADSPEAKVETGLALVSQLIYADTVRAFDIATQLDRLAGDLGLSDKQSKACNYLGTSCAIVGDYAKALAFFEKGLALAEQLEIADRIIVIRGNIGGVYYHMGEFDKAIEYYEEALAMAESKKDLVNMANQIGNLGSAYREMGDTEKALEYNQRSLALHQQTGHQRGIVIKMSTTGAAFVSAGQIPTGIEYLHSAIAEAAGYDKRTEAFSYSQLGNAYMQDDFEGKNLDLAEEYLCKSLTLTEEAGITKQSFEVHLALCELYEKKGEDSSALKHFRRFHELEKKVYNEEAKKQAIHLEYRAQIKAAEKVNQIERSKNAELAKAFKQVDEERSKSDQLLLNILPELVAEELKEDQASKARHYDHVSVLFTDFVGFTAKAAHMEPQRLVDELHTCFQAFDQIVQEYRVEKIKTIGDAYMAACGLPLPVLSHAKNTVLAALAMQAFMTSRRQDGLGFDMRIGIHSGPVVAGVVGVHKYQYDIWGNTVNMASRMESAGEPGQINISETTYALLQDDAMFRFVNRGAIQTKHEGSLPMYFVSLA